MSEVVAIAGIKTVETYPIAEKKGERVVAFEIENVYVSRRTITELLKQAKGVADVHLGGHFGSSNDIRVEFRYGGENYIVFEPFGDNSRYWIGPMSPEENVTDISELESIFKQYKPSFWRKLLGNFLTFRL